MNPNPQLPVADLAVLALYLLGTLALGLWVGRRGRDPEGFMAAGRRIPAWAVGLTIFGTFVSSISFLALPGKSFGGDWNAFVFSLSIPLTAWLAVRFFVPFYRRSGNLSAYAHLEHRFGPWARTYAVVCYILVQIGRTGTILYLLALALAPLTGLGIPALILIASVAVIAYTLFGGMEAVIWTDVVQSIVLIGGAIACVAILLFGMPNGPGQLFEIAAQHRKFSLGDLGPSLKTSTLWVVFAYGLCINLQNFGIDQSYVQRYHAAKDDAAAARSVWLGGLLYLPVSAIFLFIGTALFAYYAASPDLLPASIDAANRPDAVFPHFIATRLPVGIAGLVIAAIFAAAQSTVSGSINCSATLVLCDVYRRYFNPHADDRTAMRVLRATSLAFGILGTAAAFSMMQIRSALDAWWDIAGAFSGGMLGLFLLGQLCPACSSRAAAKGTIVGIFAILMLALPRNSLIKNTLDIPSIPLHPLLTVVVGTLAILAAGILFASLERRQPPPPASQNSRPL